MLFVTESFMFVTKAIMILAEFTLYYTLID